MITPTDSLEVAFRAVPCLYCTEPETKHGLEWDECGHWSPEPGALAAAVRECIRGRLNAEMTHERVADAIRAYARDVAVSGDDVNVDYYASEALAYVARRLGL